MPASAERKIRRQGGIRRYRTMKKNHKIFTVAVTRRAGPRGGHTVAWPRK